MACFQLVNQSPAFLAWTPSLHSYSCSLYPYHLLAKLPAALCPSQSDYPKTKILSLTLELKIHQWLPLSLANDPTLDPSCLHSPSPTLPSSHAHHVMPPHIMSFVCVGSPWVEPTSSAPHLCLSCEGQLGHPSSEAALDPPPGFPEPPWVPLSGLVISIHAVTSFTQLSSQGCGLERRDLPGLFDGRHLGNIAEAVIVAVSCQHTLIFLSESPW